MPSRRRAPALLKAAAGYGLALAALVWVLYDIHPDRLLRHLGATAWEGLALAVVCDVLSYVCAGWRWQLLLRPRLLSAFKTTQAVYAGLFANEVMPLHFGELVRAFLVSRWTETPFAGVLSSLVVERLFDGIWLALGIGLAAILVPLPHDLLVAGDLLGGALLAATGLLVFLVLRQPHFPDPAVGSRRPWRTLIGFISRLAEGLYQTGRSPAAYLAFAASLPVLVLQVLAFWLVMQACALDLSLWQGTVVMFVVRLGSILPGPPGGVGTYQFFCVVGLAIFGVDKTLAASFSIVVFVVLTAPLWLLGAAAISRSGMSLAAIRSQLRELRG